MEKLTQQEQVRRQKMQDLIDMGIDPFGSRYDRTSNSGIIKSSYEDKTKEELDDLLRPENMIKPHKFYKKK